MERDKLVAEWCRLVGREDKMIQVESFSKIGAGRGKINLSKLHRFLA